MEQNTAFLLGISDWYDVKKDCIIVCLISFIVLHSRPGCTVRQTPASLRDSRASLNCSFSQIHCCARDPGTQRFATTESVSTSDSKQ